MPRREHAAPDWADSDEVAEWASAAIDDALEAVDTALDAHRRGAPAGGDVSRQLAAALPSATGVTHGTAAPRKDASRGASHLPRPQENFNPPVDNSDAPFRPRLDHLRGLLSLPDNSPEQPAAAASPPGGGGASAADYPHPLSLKLERLAYQPWQLEAPPPVAPRPLEETPLVYVDTPAALADMAQRLAASRHVAIDLENHSFRSYQGFTCLMQVSTRETDYIVDVIALRGALPAALAGVLADPSVVKVLHGADHDVLWLQRDFSLYVVNLFDTGQAARVLSHRSAGLAHLLDHYCGVSADKRYQLADWRLRPLSPEMLHYARSDTHYLLYIYDRMKQELAVAGPNVPPPLVVPLPPGVPVGALGTVLERSRQLCLQRYTKGCLLEGAALDDGDRWAAHLPRGLAPQHAAVFDALYRFRDRIAREEDEGTGYLLPRRVMVQLAQAAPATAKDVQSLLGRGVPDLMYRQAGKIAELIAAAKSSAATSEAAAGGGAPALAAAAVAPGVALQSQAVAAAAVVVEPLSVPQQLPAFQPRAVAPIAVRKAQSSAFGGAVLASSSSAATALAAAAAAPIRSPPSSAPLVAIKTATTSVFAASLAGGGGTPAAATAAVGVSAASASRQANSSAFAAVLAGNAGGGGSAVPGGGGGGGGLGGSSHAAFVVQQLTSSFKLPFAMTVAPAAAAPAQQAAEGDEAAAGEEQDGNKSGGEEDPLQKRTRREVRDAMAALQAAGSVDVVIGKNGHDVAADEGGGDGSGQAAAAAVAAAAAPRRKDEVDSEEEEEDFIPLPLSKAYKRGGGAAGGGGRADDIDGRQRQKNGRGGSGGNRSGGGRGRGSGQQRAGGGGGGGNDVDDAELHQTYRRIGLESDSSDSEADDAPSKRAGLTGGGGGDDNEEGDDAQGEPNGEATVVPFDYKAARQQQQQQSGRGGRGGRGGHSADAGRGGRAPRGRGGRQGKPAAPAFVPPRAAADGSGGAGASVNKRQRAVFNPYDLPDDVMLKGGKRSAVAPRSGNRSLSWSANK